MKTYQSTRPEKTRWNGWLTVENFDWLCHKSAVEDVSVANLLNRIIKQARQNGSVPRGNPTPEVIKST